MKTSAFLTITIASLVFNAHALVINKRTLPVDTDLLVSTQSNPLHIVDEIVNTGLGDRVIKKRGLPLAGKLLSSKDSAKTGNLKGNNGPTKKTLSEEEGEKEETSEKEGHKGGLPVGIAGSPIGGKGIGGLPIVGAAGLPVGGEGDLPVIGNLPISATDLPIEGVKSGLPLAGDGPFLSDNLPAIGESIPIGDDLSLDQGLPLDDDLSLADGLPLSDDLSLDEGLPLIDSLPLRK